MARTNDIKVRDFISVSMPETISEAAFKTLDNRDLPETGRERGELVADYNITTNVQLTYDRDALIVKLAGKNLGYIYERFVTDGDDNRTVYEVRTASGKKMFAKLPDAAAYFMFDYISAR